MRQPGRQYIDLPTPKTALLLVDIQEEQRCHADYQPFEFDRVLKNASRLLTQTRVACCAVAHAQYVRDFLVAPPRPFEATLPDGTPTFSGATSGQTDFCQEVAPQDTEAVFVKNDASAFAGTKLDNWLQSNGTKWLVVCGVWTEACIAATIGDAIAKGYRVILVKDACASGSRLMHETAILNLANRLYGGAVCDTARAISLLAGQSAAVWRMVDPVPLRFTESNTTALYDTL